MQRWVAASGSTGIIARRLPKTATRVLWKWTQPRTTVTQAIIAARKAVALIRPERNTEADCTEAVVWQAAGEREKAAERFSIALSHSSLVTGRPRQGPLWRRATQQGTCVCPCQLRED